MSLIGRGLESLIPKKSTKVQDPATDTRTTETSEVHAEAWPNVGQGVRPQAYRPSSPGVLTHPPQDFQKKKRTSESIFHIEVEKIKPNPFQPRKDFHEAGLEELAQSIREFGILQPLVVSKLIKETEIGTEVEYQLIAGERRLMASKLLGLAHVPAIVKKIDEQRMKLEMALTENIQRSDLNPLEEAKAYARLQDEFGLTQREIAARVGKSREVVANTLRLLNLPLNIQEALAERRINESQARTLLGIQNPEEQRRIFENLLADKLSVRALRKRVQKPFVSDPQSRYWENKLEEKLGAPVKVRKENGKGKIIVEFHSEDEWQGILGRLLGDDNKDRF